MLVFKLFKYNIISNNRGIVVQAIEFGCRYLLHAILLCIVIIESYLPQASASDTYSEFLLVAAVV